MKYSSSVFSLKRVALSLFAVGALAACNAEPLDSGDGSGPEEVGVTAQPITYNGHDYLIVTTMRNWHDARSYCAGAGYYLATIDDASEEAFLDEQENRKGLAAPWWIGYNDLSTERWWTWIGTPSSTFYSNWAPGEPNSGDQDCATDRYNGAGQWDDDNCWKSYPFICERDSIPTTNNGSYDYTASNTSNATVNTFNYFVYVPAGRVLTVGSCGVAGASAVGDTYLRINNPNGQEIASNDDAGASCGLGSNISIVTSVSGTYVIRSGCYSSVSCSGTVAYTF